MSELLIMNKRIDLDGSPVLFETPFDAATWLEHWEVRAPEWEVAGEWLIGRNPHNRPSIVTSRASYFGNVLLEFEARTRLPATHDINCLWNAGWDTVKNERGVAYVAGLQGWWEGKVGIEKSPEYKLNAATPLFPFEPGRLYHVQAGSIEGHIFVFVDGRLLLEITDPDPIDHSRHGLVGFEAYASMIEIRRPRVRHIVWTERPQSYAPEF